MARHRKTKDRGLWICVAALLVHPWNGRLIGLAMVLLPGAIFALLLRLNDQSLSPLTAVGWSALALPSFLLAGFLHEAGHMFVLTSMGSGARFTWRLPIDMRAVPRREELRFHTCDRLAKRGLAGFVANLLCWGLLLMGVVATGKLPLAYLSLWQGVSALAATAWVADYPATDAATLREAVAFKDQLGLRTAVGAAGRATIELRIQLSVARHSTAIGPYWIEVRGLSGLQLQRSREGARAWIFSTSSDNTLLLWCNPESGSMSIVASGKPTAGKIVCMSKCGTIVSATI